MDRALAGPGPVAVGRARMNRGGAAAEIPELPVYGGSGTLPGVDLADAHALRDLMDATTDTRALR